MSLYSSLVSYSMVVLYIRGRGGLHFSGKNITQKSQAPWHYWLGITKPKSAFSMILNATSRLLQKYFFFKFIQWNFLLN